MVSSKDFQQTKTSQQSYSSRSYVYLQYERTMSHLFFAMQRCDAISMESDIAERDMIQKNSHKTVDEAVRQQTPSDEQAELRDSSRHSNGLEADFHFLIALRPNNSNTARPPPPRKCTKPSLLHLRTGRRSRRMEDRQTLQKSNRKLGAKIDCACFRHISTSGKHVFVNSG